MPRIDIKELRQECRRILAYTEGLTTDALRRDTLLGDAIFLRAQRLYDLARVVLKPRDAMPPAEPGATPGAQTPLFTQIESAGEPAATAFIHKDLLRADLDQLRSELTVAQAKIAALETDKKASHAKKRLPEPPPAAAPPTPLHLRVAPPPPPPEDESMIFLGLAKK